MKTLSLTFALTLTATQASALSNNVKFLAVDSTHETNLCVIAAEQGLKAARYASKLPAKVFLSTLCNNQKIRSFAKKFEAKEALVAQSSVEYKFKTIDDSIESQTCAVAAQQGLRAATKLAGLDAKSITCNGKSLRSFAKKYSNS